MAEKQCDGFWPVAGALTGLAGAAYLTGPFDWTDLAIIIGVTAGFRLAIAIASALMKRPERA
jgi:hypothetical protein